MSNSLFSSSQLAESSPEDFDLVSLLLADQEQLTAVEEFSAFHESTEDADQPLQSKYYQKLLPASAPAPGQQYAFSVDLDSCSGCKACVVACHSMNGLEDDEVWRRVGTVTTGSDESVLATETPSQSSPAPANAGLQHVTTACHHCEDPGCLKGCPVKAYDKDPVTGIVRHLDDQCIGCMYCTMMCPYEVPQYSKRLGIVRKCDMCHQRLSVGEAPACVQSCPNEAIAITTVSTSSAEVASDSSRIAPGAPLSSITKPTTVYVTSNSDAFDAGVPQDAPIDHVAESHWPLALMLVATQVSVGMLVVERLAAGIGWIMGNPMPADVTRWNTLAALVVGGAGLNIAPLHLGQPLRAWRVFLGLRTSWLSREAVLLGKYMGLLTLALAAMWLSQFPDWIPAAVLSFIPSWASGVSLLGAIAFGLAGVFSSAMIYIVTQRRLWRPVRTFVRFGGSAVVGGLAVSAAVFAVGGTASIALLVFAGVLSAMKFAWEWNIHLKSSDDLACSLDTRSQRLVNEDLRPLRLARCTAAILSAITAAFAIVAAVAEAPVTMSVAICLFAASVVLGECAERLLYFSSVVYDRMPGTLK